MVSGKYSKNRVVYAAHANVGYDTIKFGRTVRLDRRIMELNTHSPAQISLLAVINGGAVLESLVHSAARDARLHGEWFLYDHPRVKTILMLMKRGNEGLLRRYLNYLSAIS